MRTYYQDRITAFPDMVVTAQPYLSTDDYVAVNFVYRGTHQGEFMGIPPTGKHVTVGLIDIMHIVDGKVVEHWNVGDDLSMLQQLGVLPSL